MEDLREVGQKAIESVGNLGASNAGDLVLGIGEIIEDLRKEPEQYQEKLDHLEGLFREFALGEGYELRNNRAEEPEDTPSLPPGGNVSGYIPPSGYNFASGVFPTIGSAQPPPVKVTPPIDSSNPSSTIHPYGEALPEDDPILADEEEKEEIEEEPKPYEHKWWKKRV
ncbi:MAG: hypothetical protein ACXABY_01810 [Candidatus Thorarchaeota archaeon]|jgi:hypothetical protein